MISKLHLLLITLFGASLVSFSQCPGTGFDPCNAVPITVNGSCETMRTNSCSSYHNPTSCGSGSYRDVWGTFTVGAESEVTITWSSTNNRDGVIHLYHLPSGGDCSVMGDFVEIACANDVGSITGIMETINASLTSGETYYIRAQRVGSNSGVGGGSMCVTGTVPVVPSDCTWSLCLQDSYGDGWNGASVEVFVGGSSIGTFTLDDGLGPECIDIPINLGDDIFVDYTAGSWSYENEFYLYDSFGNLTYSEGTGDVTPNDYTYAGADCDPHVLPPTEQDCLGAIPICGDSYSTTNSYSGVGNVTGEINPGSSCLLSGERNDVWYIFTVQQDGDLMFTITPNEPTDDYDWAVFNLTNSSCSDIATDPSLEVSCNYSGTSGDTGPDGSSALSSQGAGGTPFNAGIPVLQNEVYVINISNYSSTQDGYFIDFSMSSGVIVDVTPPELQTIVSSPTCGQDNLTAWFTENVDTSTVNFDDFTVTGPGGPYLITEVEGTSNTVTDREYDLVLDAQLIAGGTYTLVFTGQVDDACGNTVIGNTLDFTVDGISGSTSVSDGSVVCYDDAVGSATASASGGSGTYSYLWEGGETTPTVNNLAAGTYSVTVSDDVGVCYDIVDAVINASNPLVATGTWAGTVSSDWNDCENWGGGKVPTSSMDIVIPGGCANYPVETSNTRINATTGLCNSLRVQNGGVFTITNNKDLIIDDSNLLLETGGLLIAEKQIKIISGGALIQSGGDIEIGGNFVNSSSFSSSGGEVKLNGSSEQSVGGLQPSTFSDLTLDNLSGAVLENNIGIDGNLTMTNGNLNISNKEIDFGTTGFLVSENSSSCIYSLDGFGFPIAGGLLKATRLNPSGNVAGLGLNITPSAPLGNVTIVRGHEELLGTGDYTSNRSILRYYEITSGAKAMSSVTTCDLSMSYFDSELNGHIDGTLIMFQEVDFTPGAAYFTPLTTVNNSVANTASGTTINNMLSTTKVTLGSDAKPLPINLVSFEAICDGNAVELSWTTSSETNNSFFTVEKSTDAKNFEEVETVKGNGNSNEVLKYSSFDYRTNNAKTYYRLKQTDFDSRFTYSKLVSVDCSSNLEEEKNIKLFPNPANKSDDIVLELDGFENDTEVQIVVLNVLGQQQFSETINTNYKTIYEIGQERGLPTGTYIIIGSSENFTFKKKLVVNN